MNLKVFLYFVLGSAVLFLIALLFWFLSKKSSNYPKLKKVCLFVAHTFSIFAISLISLDAILYGITKIDQDDRLQKIIKPSYFPEVLQKTIETVNKSDFYYKHVRSKGILQLVEDSNHQNRKTCLNGIIYTSFKVYNISDNDAKYHFKLLLNETDRSTECAHKSRVSVCTIFQNHKTLFTDVPSKNDIKWAQPQCDREILIKSRQHITIKFESEVNFNLKDHYSLLLSYPSTDMRIELSIPDSIDVSYLFLHPDTRIYSPEENITQSRSPFIFSQEFVSPGYKKYTASINRGILPYQGIDLYWYSKLGGL